MKKTTEQSNLTNIPGLNGSDPKAVLAILNDRKAGKPGGNKKTALVLEGGSLRGVYSSGVAHALNLLGYNGAFDVVIGTSSGALNAIFFVGNDEELGSTIYIENATDVRCNSIWRFPNMMDVNWLIREWVLGKKRFSDAAVYEGDHEIFVPATNVESGETRWFSNKRDSKSNFENAAVATSCTPLLCNQTVEIDGQRYNDGYVNAAIPIMKAIEENCTDIVIVTTRPWGYKKKQGNPLLNLYYKWRVKDYGEGYQRAIYSRHKRYNEQLSTIANGDTNFRTLVLSPLSNSEIVGNLEKNKDKIRRSWENAVNSTTQKIASLELN